ncbi:hypothetical protein PSCLAVI8L_130633 [Pseudoclavibacter sp. 8L]|nr:hypothetical protein PSCLAVI8L_130633 [Pseudoclavibacter sp. 8L]
MVRHGRAVFGAAVRPNDETAHCLVHD